MIYRGITAIKCDICGSTCAKTGEPDDDNWTLGAEDRGWLVNKATDEVLCPTCFLANKVKRLLDEKIRGTLKAYSIDTDDLNEALEFHDQLMVELRAARWRV